MKLLWNWCTLKKQRPRNYLVLYPINIYLLKVNNRNNEKRCEICSNLTIKTSERSQWRLCGVFIVNSEHNSHLFLLFPLLTLNKLILAGYLFQIAKWQLNQLGENINKRRILRKIVIGFNYANTESIVCAVYLFLHLSFRQLIFKLQVFSGVEAYSGPFQTTMLKIFLRK